MVGTEEPRMARSRRARQVSDPAPSSAPALTMALVLLLAASHGAAAGPQYLRNGGFERGFTFWTQAGDGAFAYTLTQPFGGFTRRQGRAYAVLGARGEARSISQTVDTTPGEMLTFSFALASDGGTPSSFIASFNGRALLALTDMPAFAWRAFVFRVQATGRDTISFAFRDDPGYWALDSVSLRASSLPAAARVAPIPEPPAWLLVLSAGFALAAAARFRRRLR